MAKPELSAIVLAALLTAPVATASELTWYGADALLRRCQVDPAGCRTGFEFVALTGAWGDNRISCVLDEENPITVDELLARVLARLHQTTGIQRAAQMIEAVLADAVNCPGWRRCMGSGRTPAECAAEVYGLNPG
jgi:hypothetical protein